MKDPEESLALPTCTKALPLACTKPSLGTSVACVQHFSVRINPLEGICNKDGGECPLKSAVLSCDGRQGDTFPLGQHCSWAPAASAPQYQWGWRPLVLTHPRLVGL